MHHEIDKTNISMLSFSILREGFTVVPPCYEVYRERRLSLQRKTYSIIRQGRNSLENVVENQL